MSNPSKRKADTLESIAEGLSRRCDDSFSDFRIKCGEREWKVRKAVLAMHSLVLGAACSKDFKGYIDLWGDDQDCVETLRAYLYNFDYAPLASRNLEFHVRMCIMADKYDIAPLKVLATDCFTQAMFLTPVSKEVFNKAIQNAYSTPGVTKEIRDQLINYMTEQDVVGYTAKINDSEIEQMMRGNGELATDLAKAQRAVCACVNEPKNKKRYKCREYDQTFVAAGISNVEDLVWYYYDCSEDWLGTTWHEEVAQEQYDKHNARLWPLEGT